MEHKKSSPYEATMLFTACLNLRNDDAVVRSRRLCSDFCDFLESVGAAMDALDKAYRALPAGDLKEKPLHKLDASILKRRQFMDNKLTLNKFRLDQLENLGSQQTQVVQQSLAANLHDIPLYITSTEAMVQLLKTSVAVAREHDTQGLRSQELTCTRWTAAAQSAIKTLQTEIDVMRGNLAIAQKDSGHSR